MRTKSMRVASIFYVFAVSTAILATPTSVLSQVEKQKTTSPNLSEENHQVIDKDGSNSLIHKQEEDGTKYECSNYTCTCTIGSDCGEMFETLTIENCDVGAPGQLECTSKPK